jgi:hypothetical protein
MIFNETDLQGAFILDCSDGRTSAGSSLVRSASRSSLSTA